MKLKNNKEKVITVYSILQKSDYNGYVEMVGCYTDYNVALKICKKLNKIYTQEYYINECLLDYDYQKALGQ
jgi:prolyl-tRNA synthetase